MSGGARRVPATWVTYREAARIFLGGATLRSGVKIGLVVGTWLTLMNQGGRVVDGDFPWVAIVLNYATPFVVSSLGFLAARRRSSVERLAALLDDGPDPPAAG